MYRYERKRHEKQTNLEQQHHSTKSDINHDMRYPALSHDFDSRLLKRSKITIKLVGNRVHWPRHQSSPGCDQDRTDLGCQGLDQPFYSECSLQNSTKNHRIYVSFPDLFQRFFWVCKHTFPYLCHPHLSSVIISTVFLAGKTFNQSQSTHKSITVPPTRRLLHRWDLGIQDLKGGTDKVH